jgi:hypothetical protein
MTELGKHGDDGRVRASTARVALNQLALACRDEQLALESAALVSDADHQARLGRQSRRRATFRRDLGKAVVALGGVTMPAESVSYSTKLSAALGKLREFFAGARQGDAYQTCARATENTLRAYASALSLDLPGDIRFGVAQQRAEVDFDYRWLKRLRWGGTPDVATELAAESERA